MHRGGLRKSERLELWERWRQGESVTSIARALGRWRTVVVEHVRARGGIAPRPKTVDGRALSLREREEISLGLIRCESYRALGRRLKRDASTISREVNRNGGRAEYRAVDADRRAEGQAQRPKRCKLALNARLRAAVAQKLARNWSPEQISQWLKVRYVDTPSMRVSHETIYRSLFIQARGVLKKELQKHLRSRRPTRRARASSRVVDGRGHLADAVSIRQRPASVDDRAVPGHWEGDLLTGSLGNCIATLVERQSRYTMLIKVGSNDTQTVIAALKKQISKLPIELRKSLTWDRGPEMRRHRELTFATDIAVYFCDPQSPWQRGSNENTNGLLRQYFPKGVSISGYSQAQLNKVARELNERPRKTLGFRTPAEVLSQALQ